MSAAVDTRVRHRGSTLADLPPGYFALVMATGIVSIDSQQRGFHTLAVVLLWFNVVAYVVLWCLFLLRLARFPRRMLDDLTNHAKGAGFLTMVAGTNVLGSELAIVAGRIGVSVVLWWVGLVLWTGLLYAFLAGVTFREPKPDLGAGINGSWLLLIVATESIAVLGTYVAATVGVQAVLFISLVAYLVGAMLYIWVTGLVFYRWTFFPMSADQATPPYWINMGALAISALAGSLLILATPQWSLLQDMKPFLIGATLLFWAFATWWIPLLLIMGVWRHGVQRVPLRYDPQFWALVFPIGMYSAATTRLIQALDLSFGVWIAVAAYWGALVAWLITAVAMVAAERPRRPAVVER